MGGPVRNQITRFYLKTSNPWITFDDAKKKFMVCRGERAGEELDPSDKLAVLEKMIVGGEVVLVAFGYGEIQTKIAVRYLACNWRELDRKHEDREFGVCLSVDDKGEAQVLLELTDHKETVPA